MKYDFLIKNGIIFDGSPSQILQSKTWEGKKSGFIKDDIAIKDDRIKKIGKLDEKDAEQIIDAENMYVCPGFIDLTSHSDTFWTIFSDPRQESLIKQGVTTILGGNCGSSLVPIVSPKNIESIQKWTDISKININWQTTEEFFDELEKLLPGINFATLIGHGTLRRNIIGDETRQASDNEIKKMKFLLERSLEEGAAGLSFNLGTAHEKAASGEEIIELSKTAAEKNRLIKHHLEDEGKNLLPSISHLIGYVRASGARTQISHFKAIGRSAWEKFDEAVSLIEKSRQDNLEITLDIFPYTKTNSNLYALLPEWARKNGKTGILALLRAPEERKSVIGYLENLTLHYDKMTVAGTLWDSSAVGKTIAQISQSTGFAPAETILNLLELNELKVSIFNEAIKEEHIVELLKKPYAMAASDGAGYDISKFQVPSSKFQELLHPRSFGTFPRIFSEFVKNKKTLDWQSAVYKMSAFPAKILGLRDRGVIKEGVFADIIIFDPETIADRATYENPFQFSEGVKWVFINGEPALRNGEINPERFGRILKF